MNSGKKYAPRRKYGTKKFTAKRRYARISRGIKGDDTTSVKSEFNTGIYVPNASDVVQFEQPATNFWNIFSILNNSVTFQDMATRYARYKITGMSLRFDSCLLSNVTTLSQMPIISICFYPQAINTNLGDAPLYNDKKAVFNPAIATPQTKYWRFPDNYFVSSNGGYGTWNDMSSYTNIQGQLSAYNPPLTANASAITRVGILRVTLYTVFSGKNI